MSSEGSNSATKRLPGLTALRGLAIALVLVRHAFPNVFGGGGVVGVTVFFTLSGYLITGVLVGEVRRTGRVSFRRFYRNRALRLGPALIVLLTAFVIVELTTDRLHDRHLIFSSVLVAVTYTADLLPGRLSPGLGHLWTLAVEEQFYLVWPTVLIFAARCRRPRTVTVGATALATAAMIISVLASSHQAQRLYDLPTSWALTLAAGALTYQWREELTLRLSGARGHVAAGIGLAVLLALCFVPNAKDHLSTYFAGGPLVAVCASVLIIEAVRIKDAPWPLDLLARLGTISYAVYLWDYLIVMWLDGSRSFGSLPVSRSVLSIPLSIAAATASWFLVERPILRWKDGMDRSRALPAQPHPRTPVIASGNAG